MKIHIGELVKDIVKRKRFSVPALAEALGCTRENVYRLYNVEVWSTQQIEAASNALGVNLFAQISSDETLKDLQVAEDAVGYHSLQTRNENQQLNIELQYLRRELDSKNKLIHALEELLYSTKEKLVASEAAVLRLTTDQK